MAILENNTKHYYKLDLSQSFIQKNMVFGAVVVYGTENDRKNEKDRLSKFMLFDSNCKMMLKKLNEDVNNIKVYSDFARTVADIISKRYISKTVSYADEIVITKDIEKLLEECGYRQEWIKQPICILSNKLINCGKHTGDLLTAEYVYSKLKSKMSTDISNI